MKTFPLYLAGSWVSTNNALEIINPFDQKKVGAVFLASKKEASLAIQKAVESFSQMKKLSSAERAHILHKIKEGMMKRRDELAHWITQEMGKPIGEALKEVDRAVNTFEIAAEEAKRLGGEIIPLDLMETSKDRVGLNKRFPVGLVFGITPFNYPLNLAAHKIAPAIAVGNPIILKPPPQCPINALILAEIVHEAGLPEGALSILPCENDIAEEMALDGAVQLLTFTGSASVGWQLKQKAQKQKVVLELGGIANLIVEPDADLQDVVTKCLNGAFSNAGQSCISTQRIYVHKKIYKKFLDQFVPEVKKMTVGDPQDKKTRVGPLLSLEAAGRVESWVSEAVEHGAQLLCGGQRKESLYWPTVLVDVKDEMKISCEEVFGPVCSVFQYEDFDDILDKVNQTPFGLQAGVYSNDIQKIWKAYERLDVGGLIVNDTPTFRLDHMPYGGIKDSGLGREGLRYAMEEMTEMKILVLRKNF